MAATLTGGSRGPCRASYPSVTGMGAALALLAAGGDTVSPRSAGSSPLTRALGALIVFAQAGAQPAAQRLEPPLELGMTDAPLLAGWCILAAVSAHFRGQRPPRRVGLHGNFTYAGPPSGGIDASWPHQVRA